MYSHSDLQMTTRAPVLVQLYALFRPELWNWFSISS